MKAGTQKHEHMLYTAFTHMSESWPKYKHCSYNIWMIEGDSNHLTKDSRDTIFQIKKHDEELSRIKQARAYMNETITNNPIG